MMVFLTILLKEPLIDSRCHHRALFHGHHPDRGTTPTERILDSYAEIAAIRLSTKGQDVSTQVYYTTAGTA